MTQEPSVIWHFANAQFDEARWELRVAGAAVELEPRPLEVLLYLLRRAGEAVSKEELLTAVYGHQHIGDGALSNAIGKLRRALGDDNQSLITTVHRVGYRLAMPVTKEQLPGVGAPRLVTPALGQNPLPEIQAARRRRWLLGCFGMILCVLGSLLWLYRGVLVPRLTGSANAGSLDTIAVLPLIDDSVGPDGDYLSDGVSEELIGALARNRKLRVIARASSFQFKGKTDTAQDIGAKLGARYLLEGRLRKNEQSLHLVADLVDAADGTEIWSQTYDRDLRDIFTVQAEIAQSVAGALNVAMSSTGGRTPPPTESSAAHTAYLLGRFYYGRFTVDAIRKSIGFFDEAIRLDPNYAPAYAELSVSWSGLGDQTGGTESTNAYASARAAAQKALSIDPNLAEGHAALGWVLLSADWNLPGAEVEIRRAVELAPTEQRPLNNLAVVLASLGRLDEAVKLLRRSLPLNPLSASVNFNLASYLIPLGRYDEAVHAIRQAIELQPAAPGNHAMLAIIDIRRGDSASSLEDAKQESDEIWRMFALALAYQARGDQAAADAALEDFIGKHADDSPSEIGDIYAFRGDLDQAFRWLNQGYKVHDTGAIGILYDPFFLAHRADPRFDAFCEKLGLRRAS